MLCISFDNPIIKQDMLELDEKLPEISSLFKKSIYISGASGMIAAYLVAYLIWVNETRNAGIQIHAGIRNQDKAIARFGDYAKRDYFNIVLHDVVRPFENPRNIDYIVHAASFASPQYYGIHPVETMLPNVVGTHNLLEYCKTNSVDGFLFLSSGSVYGTIETETDISEDTIGSMDFLASGNTYGESKRCGEALSNAYWNEYGVPAKIARVHHTYGPTLDTENDTRVFAEFVKNVINNEDIVLTSSGTAKRSFCYITDTISALVKILLRSKPGEVYNVGNPDEYKSIMELAQIMTSLFPSRNLSIKKNDRKHVGYCASPEKRLAKISVEKLRKLNWSYTVSVEEGFRRTVSALEA